MYTVQNSDEWWTVIIFGPLNDTISVAEVN